jgi:hypothetical protein
MCGTNWEVAWKWTAGLNSEQSTLHCVYAMPGTCIDMIECLIVQGAKLSPGVFHKGIHMVGTPANPGRQWIEFYFFQY